MTQSLVQMPVEGLDQTGAGTKLVPFDQVVTVNLKGERDNVVRAVTNISVEGQYVATAIGYSLLAESQAFGPVDPEPEKPPPVVVESLPSASLAPPRVLLTIESDAAKKQRQGSVTVLGAPRAEVEIKFDFDAASKIKPRSKKVILDASGKSKETLLKALKKGTKGNISVKDLTHGKTGPEIEFTVADSKVSQTAPQFGNRLPTYGHNSFDVIGPPNSTVEILIEPPLPGGQPEPAKLNGDGFLRVELRNRLQLGSTVTIKIQGSNEKTIARLSDDILTLNLSDIPFANLRHGFRINGSVLRRLERGVAVPAEELGKPFEPCGSNDLSFLYTITDLGSGRELQNEPIHNIAGLGIANGDRPFRTFPKPIVFKPRSVIQFEVREISGGPGTLYFVLQGYKVLGAGSRSREV